MKTVNRNVRRGLKAAWCVAGALLVGCPFLSQAINVAESQAEAAKPEASAPQFSSGIADIVKMVDAKVDPEVIKTYLKSSPVAYNPSATEIIALKEHGVGPELLTAMLQRGAELRAESTRAAAPAPNPVAPQVMPGAVNPYAPVYDYSPPPVYQSFTYPSSLYVSPSYSYASPVYYGGYDFGYSWPWYWPSFYFGCGYGGAWGRSYCSPGYRYPYCYNGYGYGGYYGGYNGNHGYYRGGAYLGNRGGFNGHGYYNIGARTAPYAVRGGSFHSVGVGSRPAGFTGAGAVGGFRAGGGFSGRPATFGSHAGGGGGRPMGGRGR